MEQHYYILDEENQYVSENSIRCVDEEWFYLPFKNIVTGVKWYTKKERANQALKQLEYYNELGGLKHKFRIEER